jgi:hypothetical protein
MATYAKERGYGWHRVHRGSERDCDPACGRKGFPHPDEPCLVVELATPPAPYCLGCSREDRVDRREPIAGPRVLLTLLVVAVVLLAVEWLMHGVSYGVLQNFTP